MPANLANVDAVFNAGGTLVFRRNDGKIYENKLLGGTAAVQSQYKSFNITAGGGAVTVQEVTKDTGDGIAVLYDDNTATVGEIGSGGWLYSDSFSGCVFYLYRNLNQRVYGVHAARATGKLADPTDFMRAAGAKLLYRFDTLGRMIGTRQGQFAAVLCHVGQAEITAWFVAKRADDTVSEVLDKRVIPNWRRYELADPAALKVSQAITYAIPGAKKSLLSKLFG